MWKSFHKFVHFILNTKFISEISKNIKNNFKNKKLKVSRGCHWTLGRIINIPTFYFNFFKKKLI